MARRASLISIVRFNLRRLSRDGAAPWVLGGVVLVVAFWAAAAPRFLNSVSDDALRTATTRALPRARNIIIEQGARIPATPGEDPFARIATRQLDLAGALAPAVTDIVDAQRYVVDSPNYDVSKFPGDPGDPPARRLSFRYQEDVENRVRVVEGSLPAAGGSVVLTFDEDNPPLESPVFQVAITRPTAELMQLGVGDRAVLAPEPGDPLVVGVPTSQLAYRLVVEVSGIIEPIEPDAEYWMSDRRLHQPSLNADAANPDAIIVNATGLMASTDYQRLLTLTRSALWRYTWRFFVDPDRFDAGDIEAIGAGLQDLQLELGSPVLARIDELRLTTGLERIFTRYESQRELTISILSLAAAGLLALALAVVALLGALTADRRRPATTLARSRGGSGRQLGWAQVLEGVVLLLPFALAGYLAARAIVDGREPGRVILVVLAVVVGVAALIVAPALPILRGDLGRLLGDEAPDGASSARRLVIEITLGAAALGGLALFRLRGLRAGRIVGGDGGFDPLLAAVPVLLALGLGLVLLRLYPLLVQFWGWLGRRGRDVVAFVGFRRLARQSPATRLPLPVTLLAVGIAIFGAVLVASIEENREAFTWREVGADYALVSLRSEQPISASIDLSQVPAVAATADSSVTRVRIETDAGTTERVPLVALDTAGYQAVTAGTGADAAFPDSMVSAVVGSDALVPAIVSSFLPGTDADPGENLIIEGPRQVVVRLLVQEVRDQFPGFDPGEPFIIVPRVSIEEQAAPWDLRPTRRYLRAPVEAGPALATAIAEQSAGTLLVSRANLLEELSDSPLVAAVSRGYRGTVVVATAFAVLAALAAIALTAHDRARDLGFLRTMGLSTGQVARLTIAEQVPWALMAVASGVGFAFILIWLLQPGLDISPFTGGDAAIRISIEWGPVLAVAGGVLAVLMVAIALYSYRARRLNLGNVLRLGDRG